MLHFAVYDEQGPAAEWPLINAHLIGPDDVPVPGRIRFKSGRIVIEKRGNRAAGIALLYDAAAKGRLMLQTCLLPEREEPYILSVELARHRIKTFIAKSEEWQMFDLSPEHPAMSLWERARRIFTDAMISEDPLDADRKARESLEAAIEATERLALAHAEILLHRRFGNRRASSSTLGVRIWPGRSSKGVRELVSRDFDVLQLPLRWRELEVEEGRYNWDLLDRWMTWAREQGKPIMAGPLVDFSKAAVPEWMYVWQHDYDTCRDMVYDHLERVVQRYRSYVGIWNLCSGINTNRNFRFTPDQMIDLTRMANLIVRQARKGARTLVELAEPFAEHCAKANDSMHPIAFIERLTQEGVRIDALGVQVFFGERSNGRAARDLMQISNLLDRYFFLEMPVVISCLGVPSRQGRDEAGWWTSRWSPEVQASWVSKVFGIVMSKPFVESVFWAELYDHDRAMVPHTGLITDEGRAKPALAALVNRRRRLRKPLGPLELEGQAESPAEDS